MSKRLKALEAKLDARKRKAAYLLVENELRETGEKRTQEDIAEEIGVTYKCLWEWKSKDPVFIEYKNALADDFLSGEARVCLRSINEAYWRKSAFCQGPGFVPT
jgi:hypothetical protein